MEENYDIIKEAEKLFTENLEKQIDRFFDELWVKYAEAYRKADWKLAHDILFLVFVRRPYSWQEDFTTKAERWVLDAKHLLDR